MGDVDPPGSADVVVADVDEVDEVDVEGLRDLSLASAARRAAWRGSGLDLGVGAGAAGEDGADMVCMGVCIKSRVDAVG